MGLFPCRKEHTQQSIYPTARVKTVEGNAVSTSTFTKKSDMPLEPARRPFSYPVWPTSKPGPQATAPPSGQYPHRTRTDQMVYECYDQERGIQCVASPATVAVAHKRVRIYLPVPSLSDVEASEAEEMARWLDDGGTENKKPE